MKGLAKLPVIRILIYAFIALGLVIAPVQSIAAIQTVAEPAMSDQACPEKQPCCDKAKVDCSTTQSCFVKCGSTSGLAQGGKATAAFAVARAFSFQSISLTPFTSEPLRRPPRA